MACHPKTTLVVRTHYGDESIALVQYLSEFDTSTFERKIVVSIDTGWASESWQTRIKQGEAHALSLGFEVVTLQSKPSFSDLIMDRKNFPSTKFQWCASFLKGIPLMSWLDEHDPEGEWHIAIAKRQALYSFAIPEFIESCEYHGERRVWHPLLGLSQHERDALLAKAGFEALNHRSLECDPCINSHDVDLKRMAQHDHEKLKKLELVVNQTMFPVVKKASEGRQSFSMGCGDYFGCGL